MQTKLTWQDQMSFVGQVRGHEFELDAMTSVGGLNRGPTPKEYVLSAICGCTGMDVISLLKKSNSVPLKFDVSASAELTKSSPKHFDRVLLKYEFLGELDVQVIIKAIEGSLTKYCGVSFMISKTSPIDYEAYLNGNLIGRGSAKFE